MTAFVTTHILDTAAGRPAGGVEVSLREASDLPEAVGALVDSGTTDIDGRLGLGPDRLADGAYVLTFLTGAYFGEQATDAFYPEVTVMFRVAGGEHYHVPLLLSPFGYSTYRGS